MFTVLIVTRPVVAQMSGCGADNEAATTVDARKIAYYKFVIHGNQRASGQRDRAASHANGAGTTHDEILDLARSDQNFRPASSR